MLAATFIAVLFIPLFFVWTSVAGEWVKRRAGGLFAGRRATTSEQSGS